MREEMKLNEQMRLLVALALLTPLAGLAKPPPVDMGSYVEPKEPAVKAALETVRARKLGLMVHFGLYSQAGIVESCPFAANPRADIVKTFFDACRARGLGVTAYYSKADWHHPDYWEDAGIGHRTTRNPTYEIMKDLPRWKRFQDFTRSKDGQRVFAICLWKEGERELHTQELVGLKDIGEPKRIVHLATGREIPFSVGKNGKTVLEFPADFPRDAHADAFEIFSGPGANGAETWRVSEIAFESRGATGADVELDVVFT